MLIPQTYLSAASSSSCGLFVAPITNILSLGSAITWHANNKIIITTYFKITFQIQWKSQLETIYWHVIMVA